MLAHVSVHMCCFAGAFVVILHCSLSYRM
jgi:hypothetical protein